MKVLFCGETTRSQSTLILKTYKQLLNRTSKSLQTSKTCQNCFHNPQNTTFGVVFTAVTMANTRPRFSQFVNHDVNPSVSSRCEPFSFTYENLYKCLYQRNEESTSQATAGKVTSAPRRKGSVSTSKITTKKKNGEKPTFAKSSCPDELDLCPSTTGLQLGIRTKQIIPEGTWMGPYQGNIVKPKEVTAATDTSYMWEIYENGKLLHYVDGRDENTSSWMRFIRCARHKEEQNLYAFQYNKEIYYRAFADIPAGSELLVWYEDTYPQYMGIPLKITDISLEVYGASSSEHCGSPVELRPPKEFSGWKNIPQMSPHKSPVIQNSWSAVVSLPPEYAQYHANYLVTADDHQSGHERKKRRHSQTNHYGQQGLNSQRRAIVINSTTDVPDPFSILAKEK